MDMSSYNIYLGKSVTVTANGVDTTGTLTDVNEQGVRVDDVFVDGAAITDVRYLGTLDANTYEPKRGALYTPESFVITEDALRTLFGDTYSFGEFVADYSAHLVFDENRYCLTLCDVALLRRRHAIHRETLLAGPLLYRLSEGGWFFACYTEEGGEAYLSTNEARLPFNPEQLADVTSLPAPGDTVTVTLSDGRELSSTVSDAGERGLALIDGYVGHIAYRDIVSIRRTGLCSRNNQRYYFGGFPARLRYFHDRNLIRYKTGHTANFFVGMTSLGLVAKDIVPIARHKTSDLKEAYGVLTNYMTFSDYGYVSPDYHRGDRETGTYRVVRRNFTSTEPNTLDTRRFVYTVRMTYDAEQPEMGAYKYKRVRHIEVLEAFSKREYLAVSIDENGAVTTVLNPDAFAEEDTVREGYGFLFLYDRDNSFGYIARSFDGNRTVKAFTVKHPSTHPLVFKGQPVNTRANVYLVSYRYDTGDLPERSDWVPAVYSMQLLRALPPNARYDVTENGEVIEHDRFAALDTLKGYRIAVERPGDRPLFGRLGEVLDNGIVLIDTDERAVEIAGTDIRTVYGIGNVTNYQPPAESQPGFGFIDIGTGLYFPESQLRSDAVPKVRGGDTVCFVVAIGRDNRPFATKVCPLPKTTQIGYVIAQNDDGSYRLLDEESYRTVVRQNAAPVAVHSLLSAAAMSDFEQYDYKVRVQNTAFIDGTPMREGITEVLEALPKLHFGHLDHFFLDKKDQPTQGMITPYDLPGVKQVYFHRRFNPIIDEITVDMKRDYGTVSFYYHPSVEAGKNPTAENMQFVATPEPVAVPDTDTDVDTAYTVADLPDVDVAGIDTVITRCLQYNLTEHALVVLRDYADRHDLQPLDYEQKRLRVLEKRVKDSKDDPEAASAARLEMLDCIGNIRAILDNSGEQYGRRLKLILDQARILVQEGRSEEAVAAYRAWDTLLREYVTIYPTQLDSYRKIIPHVKKMLKALTDDDLDVIGTESETSSIGEEIVQASELHPYIRWRQEARNNTAAAWKVDPLAALRGELDNALGQTFYQRAQYLASLLLMEQRADVADDLAVFFENSLLDDRNSFRCLLTDEEAPSRRRKATVKKCSPFTLDSLLLFANTELDRQAWVHRFDGKPALIDSYCRELCCLLEKEAPTDPDLEALNALFTAALEFVKTSVADSAEGKLLPYSRELLSTVKTYQRLTCAVAPKQLLDVLSLLPQFERPIGFGGRLDCLRKAAGKLQDYQNEILNEPTVYGWHLFWPLCRQLLRRVFNAWETLCQTSQPAIAFGTVTGVRLEDGSWQITVPVHNEENRSTAEKFTLSVTCGGKTYVADRRDSLLSNENAAYVVVFPVEDTEAQQLSLELHGRYQYVAGLAVSGTQYRERYQEETVLHTCTVSCVTGERVELSKAVIDMIGKEAKSDIKPTSETARTVLEILKNRAEEVRDIVNRLTFVADDGTRRLYEDGRWIALYGQWRVGKTVLLYEVFRVLRGEDFRTQALPAYTSFSAKEKFEADTVKKIRMAIEDELEFGSVEEDAWLAVYDAYTARYGAVDTLLNLARVVRRYHQQEGVRHIVLALDEFTRIYEAIKNGHTTAGFLRDFIEFINLSGCIVLTAGGEHTVELIDVNMAQKADHTLNVRYLSPAYTAVYVEKVISEPSYLGNAEQKAETIDRIYRLTQGNVYLLHLFCLALIDYVLENKTILLIDNLTIERTLDKIVRDVGDRLESVMNIYFNSLFNPYNEGDEEDLGDGFMHVRDANRKLMAALVRNAYQDSHVCRKEQLKAAVAEEIPDWETFLDRLCRRDIVKDDGHGNLSIPIDLFYELQTRIDRKDG